MYKKKECVAMLLAGGQGSRLYTLTEQTAKPAVQFGGKYRIIDFPMSNCVNSGIYTVGVLTQYQPLVLNEYIGNGEPWDLDRVASGVRVLPPYQGSNGADWYKGTANAIYQNLNFIDRYDPDYVLVLSGDHIYKMDYSLMLKQHKETGADCTIAVLDVPLDQASRFGIMNTDENDVIVEFEEKPVKPKSNKASMGIYVFSWPVLRQYLINDEADPTSKNDFGKNIIPKMLGDGCKMMAYGFEGYWKDVGTIYSLWEANMELLQNPPAFNLYENKWRIYARNPIMPPHYVADTAKVTDSMVTEGCEVSGEVTHSILFAGVTVEEGAKVIDSVIMPGTTIKAGAVVYRAIVAENAVVSENCVVGNPEDPDCEIALVGQSTVLPVGFTVKPGEQIDVDVLTLERSADV